MSADVEDSHADHVLADQDNNLASKKLSWGKLPRIHSLDMESGNVHGFSNRGSRDAKDWYVILHLAFQSIGVVFGDLGTSPLYVYPGTLAGGVKHHDDILGVFSLILYTLTIIPLIKYVLIVLKANDNGDGGTFALYSLICRYADVGLIPSLQAEDANVSNFRLNTPCKSLKMASKLKSCLEKSKFAKLFLLLTTMLGTSMLIGDGIITPSISVLSAVSGIKEATNSMTQDRVVWISVIILICLFMVQRFGTDKIGYTFAPIMCLWFIFISGIGVYNFIKFDPTIVKAINPKYIIDYFKRNKKQAWISLGGIILCTTGAEAMFADVGHFTIRSVQISMCAVTYPAIVMQYAGQTAFLRKHHDDVGDLFFKSIPHAIYWPTFVLAILAAIIASQALISGTFSVVQQSLSLGCFPRVKVVHTSTKYEGQVYIPEVNYLLMLACAGITLGFRTPTRIGNAYGIAFVFVMVLTSALMVLIMILIWKTNILLVISYVVVIGGIELLYLSSVLYKFDQGGYLPLALALVLMIVMYVWNDVYRRKYYYELKHKVSPEMVKEVVRSTKFRMPGLAIFYSELAHGIPPIFTHYMANIPALPSVLVFVSIKSLPVSKVPVEERFLFRKVALDGVYIFRCAVRYGYTDAQLEEEPFEKLLVERLKNFTREDITRIPSLTHGSNDIVSAGLQEGSIHGENRSEESETNIVEERLDRDIEVVDMAASAGIVHLMGETELMAGKGSKLGKRIWINIFYNALKRNLRETDKVFDIPQERMLKVGMVYEL